MLGADGSYYGPANLAMLDQWAKEGRVLADTVLVEQGTNRQVHARDVPSLQHHFQLAPKPPTASVYTPYQPTATPYQPSHYVRPGPQTVLAGPRKSKAIAAVLALVLGIFGAHRFYLGHTMVGIAMLVCTALGLSLCCIFVVGTFVWAIIDMVMVLTNNLRDADGRALE